MPRYPDPYEQGLRDGFLLPVVLSLNAEDEMDRDILTEAKMALEQSQAAAADAGYEEELVLANTLANQAIAAALISIAEAMELQAEMQRTAPEGF